MAFDDVQRAFSVEGQFARQGAQKRDPQGVDVGAIVRASCVRGLFRRHVVGRSQSHPGGGDVYILREGFGEPQIHELYLAVQGEEDVVRLDVPMDDGLFMRILKGQGHGFHDSQCLVQWQLLLALQALLQASAIDEFHGEELASLVFAVLEDLDDIGMTQRLCVPCLTHETFEVRRVFGELFGEDLDGHFEFGLAHLCFIDGAHPALSKLAEERIIGDGVRLLLGGGLLRGLDFHFRPTVRTGDGLSG